MHTGKVNNKFRRKREDFLQRGTIKIDSQLPLIVLLHSNFCLRILGCVSRNWPTDEVTTETGPRSWLSQMCSTCLHLSVMFYDISRAKRHADSSLQKQVSDRFAFIMQIMNSCLHVWYLIWCDFLKKVMQSNQFSSLIYSKFLLPW